MDRRGLCLKHIPAADGVGIEIGALDRPVVTRENADIRYVDHLDTDGLRTKYRADPNVVSANIVDVAYVWSGGSVRQAVGSDTSFDFAVACHVVEHAPNLIQWLNDIHGVLKPGGRLLLVVPDKRFTFDLRRRCTEISDAIDAYFAHRDRPSYGQIYDFFDQAVEVEARTAWSKADVVATAPGMSGHGPELALTMCRHAHDAHAYVDVHCSVFTPYSFFDLMRRMIDLCPDVAMPFRVIDFVPTPVDDLEFFVALEALAPIAIEPYSTEVAQRLAREAGYTGTFGAGGFAAAIKADDGLRRRNEALTESWRKSRGGPNWVEARASMVSALPKLDRRQHHDQPAG